MDTRALAEQFEPVLNDLDLTCAGVEWLPAPGHSTLRVYIESLDREVGIDDCEKASHELSAILDVEELITVPYSLEVSTPGLERPLFTLAQYQRFVGEKVKFVTVAPINNRRRFTGVITMVHDEVVQFVLDNGEKTDIEFEQIEKAHLVPDWEALGFAPKAKPSGNKSKGKRKKRKK